MSTDRQFETLAYEVADGIATVTFNRPEVRNALNRSVLADLGAALAVVRDDEGVGADLHTGQVVERLAQSLLYTTQDKAEGASAFIEKRTAQFGGH